MSVEEPAPELIAPADGENEANLQPPLHLPPPESLDVAALHTTPPFNPASCKTRGPSVSVETPAPDMISSADGGDDLAPTFMQPSLQAASKSMGAASGSATVLASAEDEDQVDDLA